MKKFIKLLKDKKWRWTAGGVMCLVVASMIFALSSEVTVLAEDIVLGDVTITEDNGVYKISTAAELTALGNATKEQTSGKTFHMVNDIKVPSMTTPATGMFAGKFDGNGHVITYGTIDITVTDKQGTSDSKAQGLLFGTLEDGAEIQNMIIDIQDKSASYTRKSMNGYENGTSEIVYNDEKEALFTGTVDMNNGLERLNEVHAALTGNDPSITRSEENGTVKYTQILKETGTRTTTYAAQEPGTDYFGLVCGENKGIITKVYVTGNDVTIAREEQQVVGYSRKVESGYKEEKNTYEQSVTTTSSGDVNKELKVTSTAYSNAARNYDSIKRGAMKVAVSAPENLKRGDEILYTIDVTNLGTEAYQKILLNASVEGKWSLLKNNVYNNEDVRDSYEWSNENEIVNVNEKKTIYFSYTPKAGETSASVDFTVKAYVTGAEEYYASTRVSSITTPIFDEEQVKEEKVMENGTLGVSVSAPKNSYSNEVVYTVTVTNKGSSDCQTATVDAVVEGVGTWKTLEDEALKEKNVSFPLSAGKSKTLSFTYTPTSDELQNGQTIAKFDISDNLLGEGNSDTVSITNLTTALYSQDMIGNEEEARGIQLEVAAPQALINDDGTKITYDISLENLDSKKYSQIEVTASEAGLWPGGSTKQTSYKIRDGLAGNKTIDFTYEYEIEEGYTGPVEISFGVSGTIKTGQQEVCFSKTTLNDVVTTSIYSADSVQDESGDDFAKIGLTAQLSVDKSNILLGGGANLNYTLTLTNTNEISENSAIISKDIQITTDLSGWSVSGKNKKFKINVNQTLSAGESVVLTKRVNLSSAGTNTLAIDVAGELITKAYAYTNKPAAAADEFIATSETSFQGEAIVSGNYLYAGGVAGKSSGNIKEVKQEVSLIGSATNEDNKGGIGGIAGEVTQNSSLENIYMPGKVNGDSLYYTSGDVILSYSSTGAPSQALSDKWTSYKKYIYPVDTVDVNTRAVSSTEYDLSWLVKNDVKFATGTLENAEIPVTIAGDPVRESAEYDYQVAYIARKSMDQNSEDIIHLAPSIMLDESAFYGIKHVYATDGYYHYSMTEDDAVTIKYPYDQDNKSIFCDIDKFDGKTNIDTVTVTLPKKNRNESYDEASDKLYYSINIPEITEEGEASLPMTPDGDTYLEAAIRYDYDEKEERVYYANLIFGIPEIRYGVTPYIDGHIYPMIVSEDFGPFTRGALTAPIITSFDYYDKDNAENPYVEVNSTAQYESDSRWILNNAKDLEQYTPTFSVAFLPDRPEGNNWQMIEEDSMIPKYEYEGGGEPEIVVEKYEETLTLPEVESEKQYYLYMKAESKYHTTVWYCYGPFNIVPKGTLEHGIYGINSTEPAYKITGKEILEGDYLHFTSENNTVLSNSVQYLLSSKEITNFAGLTWKTYNSGTGISLVRQSENDDTLYIYARNVKLAARDSKYGEIKSWVYKFASDSSDVKANPNTISYKEGDGFEITAASTLSYNSNIQLSTITEDASIFYTQSEKSGESLTIKRVETVPDMESDGNPPAGYYNSGNRWYYISAGKEPAALYSAEDGIDVLNQTRNTKELYLSTVALAADVNPSDVLNYAYLIGEQQQVSPPESALITTTIINGKETEGTRAEIAKGATIYFTSMTPNAEILYWIGDKAVGEGQIYDSSKGIKVKGSGTTYTITLMAKEKTPDGTEPTLLDSNYVTFIYDITDAEKTDEPTATPSTIEADPAMVLKGEKILLSSPTTGAVIYYAVDGKEPILIEDESTGEYTLEEGTGELYDTTQGIVMPEGNNGFFVISAVAVKSGLAPSSIVHFTYAYPDQVQSPYANVNSGNVALNTEVILKNRTQEATIYYTVAYGKDVPEEPTTNSSVFDDANPFIITKETTIKAIAVKNGVVSNVIELKYLPFDQLEAPKASIESGSVISGGTILNLTAAKGTTIHYTTDNSDPTEAGNQAVMTGNSIILNGKSGEQVTIKAYATAEGKSSSEVVTFTYQFSQNSGGVTADVESGSLVSNGAKVNLMTDVTGAEIYYTTDGESPVTDGIKGSNVTIEGTPGSNFTIKAVAILEGAPGKVMTFTYKIKQIPNTPSATPAGGVLTVAVRVELSSNVESIYYTVDGSEPTKSSIPYTEPILINKPTILKAIAVSEDGEISKEATFVYTASDKAAAVVSNLSDGSILDPGTVVKLNTATVDAQIYYSTDGTEPTLDNLDSLLVYDGDGIEINRSVTIQAVAYKKDLRLSDVNVWSYVVETIPAVEQKKAEAAKLEEEGLRDTDASSLSRNAKNRNEKDIKRSLQDRKNQTEIVFSTDAMPESVSFESVKKENDAFIVSKAKQLFGDSDTVLSSYKFKVKEGSTPVQPKKMIEIVIPIPKGYEDAVLSVAYVSGDKKLTTLPTSRENGVLYAQTTKLGDYVVIGPEKIEETNTGIPYVLILMIVSGITLLGGVVFWINVQWYKYKLRKKNYPKE